MGEGERDGGYDHVSLCVYESRVKKEKKKKLSRDTKFTCCEDWVCSSAVRQLARC